ncbi:foldase protein PrsA [Thermoactinomyces sp. DSM 45891]|uniref:peptidylprolyl isomerase n=1 Tax=Thermoactinomyces sp. DSM 45891 TaxID=1761907 RepID=UPI00091D1418|nr:peptidylprolyl isomerase [Thermoactinomyces sp. DSM 45891]SFX39959.1 foldase protein PrsA [Thermoactinomyces sp. DSM 45891]
MSQFRKRRWIAGMIALALVLSSLAAACTSKKETEKKPDATGQEQKLPEFKPFDTKSPKILAEYEGGKVVEGKFHAFLNVIAFVQPQSVQGLADPKAKEEMLKDYAALQFISEKDPNKKSEFVKKAEEDFKKDEENYVKMYQQFGSKAKTFDEVLKERGTTRDDLKEVFGLSRQRAEFIYENYDYEDAKLNHILIGLELPEGKKRTDEEAKKRALEVKQKLEKGGDFKALAKEYSDDPGSKENAGAYEGSPAQFVPEFKKAVETLPLNKISDPVKTDYGYHVIKVTERSTKKLKDVKDEQQRSQYAQPAMDKFMKDFKVKIL